MTDPETAGSADVEAAQRVKDAYDRIKAELHKTIVGMDDVIDQLLISIFARGHCLLVGVPGLAKTLLVSSVSRCLSRSFNRIQFTPDLMPADITGTEVIQEDRATGTRAFKFIQGPIFANVILADEINRTPPQTQAALLEAMQERQVTAGGQRHELDAPFFVLATQNPIEQEGTYPLPEAQLDRFMLELLIDYPSRAEEEEIAMTTTGVDRPEVGTVVSAGELVELQRVVRRVPVAPSLVAYAVRLVRATRADDDGAPARTRRDVAGGAGPRAGRYLVLGAKARAAARGDALPSLDDVRAVAPAVLAHRVVLNFEAEADGRTTRDVVAELIDDSRSWT